MAEDKKQPKPKKKKSKLKHASRDDDVNEKINQLKERLKTDRELAQQCDKKLQELNFNMNPNLETSSRKKMNDAKCKLRKKCEDVEKDMDKTVFSVNKELKDLHEHMQKVYDNNTEAEKDVMEIRKALECMRIQKQPICTWLFERIRNAIRNPFRRGSDSQKARDD